MHMEKQVGGYMARGPYVVGPDASVREALGLMKELDIRHLPIVEDEIVQGLVSERDLRSAVVLGGTRPVSDIMHKDVYVATVDTPVADVVHQMIDKKIGSVLVVNGQDEIQGIFTTIDALRILYDLLSSEGGDALLDDYFDDWTRFVDSAEA
jgi:acetoin utilization protein AcuB